MYRKTKKFTALALSCIMLVGATNLQVYAGSSVSGTCAGTPAYGRITTNSTSATATTTYARSSATIVAKAHVFYSRDKVTLGTQAEATNSSGGISVTAVKKTASGIVTGGKGYHTVTCSGSTWGTYVTTTGVVPTTIFWE